MAGQPDKNEGDGAGLVGHLLPGSPSSPDLPDAAYLAADAALTEKLNIQAGEADRTTFIEMVVSIVIDAVWPFLPGVTEREGLRQQLGRANADLASVCADNERLTSGALAALAEVEGTQ